MDDFWQGIAQRDDETKTEEMARSFAPHVHNFQTIVPSSVFATALSEEIVPRLETCSASVGRRWTGRLLQLSGPRKQAELDLTGGSDAYTKGQREHRAGAGADSVSQEAAGAQQERLPG